MPLSNFGLGDCLVAAARIEPENQRYGRKIDATTCRCYDALFLANPHFTSIARPTNAIPARGKGSHYARLANA